MANISPTIQIYNSTTPCIIENILLGSTCSTMKLIECKAPFQEFRDVYVWLYAEIIENILLRSTCSTMKLIEYKAPFQDFRDIYVWLYAEMLGLYATIIEHHIDTWNDASLV